MKLTTSVLSALLLTLSLQACNTIQPQSIVPGPGQSAGTIKRADSPLFASALMKRVLPLATIQTPQGEMIMPAALLPTPGFQTAQAIARPMIADMAIAPGYYYGGHDFNQYTIVQAEENIYGAPTGSTLLQVYEGSIKKILGEWDASARLIESRSNVNGGSNPDANVEYINLPGRSGEGERIRPEFVFRFASSPRKETLNIYVLKNEIRAHRMVWGERNVDISKVQVDSDKALQMARDAFASRETSPGYPVYPEAQNLSREMEVLYSVPADANWQVSLNQVENNALRYYVNANFRIKNDKYQAPPPVPSGDMKPDTMPMPVPYAEEYYYVSGSLEVDAVSGKVISLNRPVVYRPVYERVYPAVGIGGGSAGSAPAPIELMDNAASK
jgi:hypothetical protein